MARFDHPDQPPAPFSSTRIKRHPCERDRKFESPFLPPTSHFQQSLPVHIRVGGPPEGPGQRLTKMTTWNARPSVRPAVDKRHEFLASPHERGKPGARHSAANDDAPCRITYAVEVDT